MIPREEIRAALNCMNADWQMQNNHLDSATKFIYKSNTIDEVKRYCRQYDIDLNYALHRWYNFNCAKIHEEIFIAFGAVKEQDPYHKTIDFYLFDVPFDLKTTYFPKAINDKTGYEPTNRKGKNNLISWFYTNQSKQGRFHLENRLFIVCEDLKSKSDFVIIENKIKQFIDYSKLNGFNEILFEDKNIYSDIIWIPNERK